MRQPWAEVLLWVVLIVGLSIVLITFPPIYRRLPWQLVGRHRAEDQELGARCIQLASEMIEFIADSARRQPLPATHEPTADEDRRREWERDSQARRLHEINEIAEFKRKFAVKASGLFGELHRAEVITRKEADEAAWHLQNLHWIDQIPQKLAEKGYELTGGLEPH